MMPSHLLATKVFPSVASGVMQCPNCRLYENGKWWHYPNCTWRHFPNSSLNESIGVREQVDTDSDVNDNIDLYHDVQDDMSSHSELETNIIFFRSRNTEMWDYTSNIIDRDAIFSLSCQAINHTKIVQSCERQHTRDTTQDGIDDAEVSDISPIALYASSSPVL